MKKISLFMLLIAVAASVTFTDTFAAKRWVLVEEFTNASCGPCAQQNPGFHTFLVNNMKSMKNIIPIVHRTSWPGADVMYSLNPQMYDKRVQYYGIDGVPNARTNGKVHATTSNWYEGAPGDATGMQAELDKYVGGTSPITITPTIVWNGNTMKINVNVATTQAFSNKKLRTAIVEGYHYYDKAGTNGEKTFYYIVRDYLPNVDGQSVSLSDNASNDYSFTYTPHPSFYSQFLYVVAYLQDDATKEVIQAGSSEMPNLDGVENLKQIPVTVTVNSDQKHGFINAGETIKRTVVVTNPNLKEITIGLASTLNAPNDWSASIDKNEVTLAAGASTNVEVSITAGNTLALGSVNIDAYPINLPENELASYVTGTVFAMHKGTKIVTYLGMGRFDNYLGTVISNSPQYKNMNNFLGILDMEAMSAYPANNFEVTVYNLDYLGIQSPQGLLGNNYTQSVAIRDNIKKALDAGKDVLIFAESEAQFTFGNSSLINGQNFFKQDLGVSLANSVLRVQTNSQGNITGIVSYQVAGVTGDPISDGMNFVCNSHQYAQAGQYFGVMTDILKLESGSKAIPFLYSDGNQANIVGIRFENSAKGKLVFISAPSAGFDINNLMTLYNKTIDWFMSQPANVGPKITTSATSLTFGKVLKGNSSTKVVTITNSGDQPLNISNLSITGDTLFVFSLGAGKDTKTIDAGKSATVEVIFAPTAKNNYTAQLRIKTNAANNPDMSISLAGEGDVDMHVGEIGSKFYLNVAPNPVNSVSNIKYEINNDAPVRLTINMVDAQGNLVGELFNGVANNGSYSLQLNGAKYSAGVYYLSVSVDGELNNIPVVIVK